MLKVGLTGGIGSGKSVVSEIFRTLNIPVYDADLRAKQLITEDAVVKKYLIKEFGEKVYFEDGQLNRIELAAIIFNNQQALQIANSIVHPAVKLDYIDWLDHQQYCKYAVIEAAILFESNEFSDLDKTITVYAPDDVRLKRVVKRDNTVENAVLKRMHAQMSEEEKIKRSDFVIINDDTKLVVPQVLELHKLLTK